MKTLNNKFIKENSTLLSIMILILLTILIYLFVYSDVSIRCAKFHTFSQVRGSKKLNYTFIYDGELIQGRMDITTLSKDEINKLKKSECIQVEVSNYWSFFNKVVE